jgi:hypothetical protein
MKPTDAPPRPKPPTGSPHARALDVADDAPAYFRIGGHAIFGTIKVLGR